LAKDVKVAEPPGETVWLTGWVVTVGEPLSAYAGAAVNATAANAIAPTSARARMCPF
jgi:hypothetical protein